MKICPLGAELFYVDGRTDGRTEEWTDGRTNRWTNMTKLTVAFRNFANGPKK